MEMDLSFVKLARTFERYERLAETRRGTRKSKTRLEPTPILRARSAGRLEVRGAGGGGNPEEIPEGLPGSYAPCIYMSGIRENPAFLRRLGLGFSRRAGRSHRR